MALTVETIYEEPRAYWITGLVTATVARMISEGRLVKAGVHFLASAVDPSDFMAELQRAPAKVNSPRSLAKSDCASVRLLFAFFRHFE